MGKNILCTDCAYCGDKYSFPLPNGLPYVDPQNPAIKRYFCCCGDSAFYGQDITGKGINQCEYFEEV
jgi:hypothetical protein